MNSLPFHYSKTLIYTVFTSILFLILFGQLVGKYVVNYTPDFVKNAAVQMSEMTMVTALKLEIPYLKLHSANLEDPPMPLSMYLFQFFTHIEPNNLLSVMESEIPSLSAFHPPAPDSSMKDFVLMESPEPSQNKSIQEKKTEEPKKATTPAPPRLVYIYNTHNTESWTFVKNENNLDEAYDQKTNISLVSKKLAEELEKKGVKTKFDNIDIQQRLKQEGLSYPLSYAASLKVAKEALKENKNITYLFDLHRDSGKKENTTVKINGKNYARIRFVIGKGNKNWKENDKLAKKFYNTLEKKYPGITSPIDHKTSVTGNGEYNQSLSPNSLLIEVGGPENTLEESYLSAAALADAFADLYFEQDRKVDSPNDSGKKPS